MTVLIRNAELKDLEIFYSWVNQDRIRKFSFSKERINFSSHSNWFLQKINSPESFLYVGEKNDVPFGQVRFDKVSSHSFDVDIHIDANYSGHGLGKKLLGLGLKKLTAKIPEYFEVNAIIFENNIASKKCFESLNFINVKKINIQKNLCNIYKWKHKI